jgi:hypothetical protein
MNEIKILMINEATDNYTSIYPCGNKKDLEECFTTHDNQIFFWFNTDDKSTHVISKSLNIQLNNISV